MASACYTHYHQKHPKSNFLSHRDQHKPSHTRAPQIHHEAYGDTEKKQSPPQEDLAQNHYKDEEYSSSEDDTALYYRAYIRHKRHRRI